MRVSTRQFRQIAWPLAVAETITFAGLLYIFAALLLPWEQDLGWGKAELSGAFSLAVLVSALLAPVVGRAFDRGWIQFVFTGTAVFGALMLFALSQVTAIWQFYLVWFLIGVGMSGCLYEATFAVLTLSLGPDARKAITQVTLVAGLASTLCFPLTRLFVTHIGWRGAVASWGGIVLLLAVPLIWWACGQADLARTEEVQAKSAGQKSGLSGIWRNKVFWLLALTYAMIALDHGMLINHIFPLFDEKGIEAGIAVFAASMIGPMQVTGRLGMLAFEKRGTAAQIFMGSFIATILAATALFWSTALAPIFLLGTFVVLQGAGYGVTSILRPLLTAQFMGKENYGAVAGMLAIPFLLSLSASTTVAAVIWEWGGYDAVLVTAGVASAVGVAALWGAVRVAKRTDRDGG